MPAPSPTSLIDVVNDADEPVGTVPRSEAFRVGANFRTVHILVFDKDGRVLLQRLAPTRARHPLLWGSSVAGYLHAGESYGRAARRRLREELGLTTTLQEIGVTDMPDEGVRKFIGVFTTRADSAAVADPEHIADIEFWDIGELGEAVLRRPDDFTPSLRHVLAYVGSKGRK